MLVYLSIFLCDQDQLLLAKIFVRTIVFITMTYSNSLSASNQTRFTTNLLFESKSVCENEYALLLTLLLLYRAWAWG